MSPGKSLVLVMATAVLGMWSFTGCDDTSDEPTSSGSEVTEESVEAQRDTDASGSEAAGASGEEQPDSEQPESAESDKKRKDDEESGEERLDDEEVDEESDPVEFAYLSSDNEAQKVQLAEVGPDGVEPSSRIDVPGQPFALTWVDDRRLAILSRRQQETDDGTERTYELHLHEDGELEQLELPDDEAWKTEKPPGHETTEMTYDSGGDLVETDDELWIRRCVWRSVGDARPCGAHSWVRILPTVLEQREDRPSSAHTGGLPRADAPDEIEVEIESGEDGMKRTVVCRRDGQSSRITGYRLGKGESDLEVGYRDFIPSSVRWIQTDPPIYGVSQWDETGEAPATGYMLFTPCEEEPHFEGYVFSAARGPGKTWAAGSQLYFEGRHVGEVDLAAPSISRSYDGPSIAFSSP